MAQTLESGEALGAEPVERLEANVAAALRRKPSHEDKLAGVLRALAPFSPRLSRLVETAVDTLVRRGTFQRPLYAAAVRSLAEANGKESLTLLSRVLAAEDAGGLASLSAACFAREPALAEPLARVAASRHPHLAFAAEVARAMRGESGGQHIVALAPKIKESHRIALCVELFVPLLHHGALPMAIAPALAVLRDAERHLGRWLVLGEIATQAGDKQPLEEARERASSGPSSARAAWSLVAWALDDVSSPPGVRPTVELVSRLSDRPSADRDPTFLYRLAEARVPSARPMLENLVRGTALKNEAAIRAATYLARDHGRTDLGQALEQVASNPRYEALRGIAAAAVYELGDAARSAELADSLVTSRHLQTMAWAALVRAAAAGRLSKVISEPNFRRVQLGWVE